MSTDLVVNILGLAGDPIVHLRMPVDATGLDLARRMAKLRAVPRFQLKLVSGEEILSDAVRLSSLPQPADIVVVRQTLAEQDEAIEELTRAVHNRDKGAVDLALCQPTTPNLANPCGASLLAQAAAMGDLEIVELLLEAGAETSGALHFALQNEHLAVAQCLMQAGAALDEAVDVEVLQVCDDEAMMRFRQAGVDVHTVVPLQFAVAAGDVNAVKLLLEAGADTACPNLFQILVRSDRQHRQEVMQALMQAGLKMKCCEAAKSISYEIVVETMNYSGEYLLLPLIVVCAFLAFYMTHQYNSGMVALMAVPTFVVFPSCTCSSYWRSKRRFGLSIFCLCLPAFTLVLDIWYFVSSVPERRLVLWAVIMFGTLFVVLLVPCFLQLFRNCRHDCGFYLVVLKTVSDGHEIASASQFRNSDLEEQLAAAGP